MNYIYGYQNKINKKWYVGQTTMPVKERDRLHRSGAKNQKASDYNCLFHKKIREYGIENFSLVILEEVPNKEDLDKREQYWIKEKNSYVKNNGYNLTTGGQTRKNNENYIDSRSKLTKDQLFEIYELLKENRETQVEIAKKYSVSPSIINSINAGKKYHFLSEKDYPIRKNNKRKLTIEEVDLIITLLKQRYGNEEIARMIGNEINANHVNAINLGVHFKKENEKYPIRKISNTQKKYNQDAEKIKDMLKNTELNMQQIANVIKCDRSKVSRINSGQIYRDKDQKYPIRQ